VAAPPGLPDPNIAPPVVPEPGDAFAVLRVLELVARVERGRPMLLDDLVASLNARYLDWLFDRAVIADALVALAGQLDGRFPERFRDRAGGQPLRAGRCGWRRRRASPAGWWDRHKRAAAECRRQLAEFSRRDGPPGSS